MMMVVVPTYHVIVPTSMLDISQQAMPASCMPAICFTTLLAYKTRLLVRSSNTMLIN